jgi:hypothetical protein
MLEKRHCRRQATAYPARARYCWNLVLKAKMTGVMQVLFLRVQTLKINPVLEVD